MEGLGKVWGGEIKKGDCIWWPTVLNEGGERRPGKGHEIVLICHVEGSNQVAFYGSVVMLGELGGEVNAPSPREKEKESYCQTIIKIETRHNQGKIGEEKRGKLAWPDLF